MCPERISGLCCFQWKQSRKEEWHFCSCKSVFPVWWLRASLLHRQLLICPAGLLCLLTAIALCSRSLNVQTFIR